NDSKVSLVYNYLDLPKQLVTLYGEYFFIPMYKNVEIPCVLCKKNYIENATVLERTALYVKQGTWKRNMAKIGQPSQLNFELYKHSFPVFNVKLMDSSDLIVNSYDPQDITFELVWVDADNTNKLLHINVFNSQKNGVYITLT